MSDDIRITDLAHPELTDAQRAAIARAATIPVTLSEDAVLAAAVEQTGLSDFGAGDFRARLRVWLQAVNEDDRLGPAGRLGLWAQCVRFLSNRLRLEDLVRRHPEILAVEIRQPNSPTAAPTVSTLAMPATPEGVTVDFSAGDMVGATIAVTAQNGERTRYSLLVSRAAPDHDANLASLSASVGTLAPAFSVKQDSYTLRLPADVAAAQITATAASPYASIVFSSPTGPRRERTGLSPYRSDRGTDPWRASS